ncbi:hypothetical protein, partial [Microbispora rosea]
MLVHRAVSGRFRLSSVRATITPSKARGKVPYLATGFPHRALTAALTGPHAPPSRQRRRLERRL